MMSLNGLPLRVFLYTRDVDMRKSFNGLLAIVQSEFKMDVLKGDTFLFLSKRRDRVKAMWWLRPRGLLFGQYIGGVEKR